MKRYYETPEIEIKRFSVASAILVSDPEGNLGSGEDNGEGGGFEVTRVIDGKPINNSGFGW